MTYPQYVKNNIFIPAKMNDSGFMDEEKNVANNYSKGEKGFYMDTSLFFAYGDIVSTVGDFYLLDRASGW